MTNESLNVVESAIADVEFELGRLDQFAALSTSSRAIIEKLESDIGALHANENGLEPKVRAPKLTNAKSLLECERSDMAGFNREIDRHSDLVVQQGQRAQSILQQVWSALLQSRKVGVEAMLRKNFDFRHLHTLATEFSSAAFCVREVEEIRTTLFHNRWLPAERDIAIADARALRERSALLLALATDEPGLELDIVNVELTPIPKSKPPAVSNELGTMSQAVAA